MSGLFEGSRGINKHCEILVSCSDKERNCIQAHGTACKLMKLHASSWICMHFGPFWNMLDPKTL